MKSQRGSQRTSSSTPTQQKLMMFAPNSQGKPQTATYATVKEAIIQQVQKTFKDGQDVAKSIEKGMPFDLSSVELTRSISAEEDPIKATVEQTGLDIKYLRYLDTKDNWRHCIVKAYALIFSNYCSR
ncbi:hypothetical protein, partial [Acidithiobacillus sp.]|uniref:hypothetical protein n=1 Tax=Acidithiobacillus sp. TaxID=1872118 RepID=UPI003D0770C7